MVNKKTGSVSTLKSKLIAAIAMLLVGAFMVVSSSYAWFTLSTAPEVTGIYTSVGANGNLEMALVPADGDLSKITSGVGDSNKNETWGNLVNLGQTVDGQTQYGLDLIQLLPARLDVMSTPNNSDGTAPKYAHSISGAGLQAPKYSADGRVDSLGATVLGKYNSSTKSFDRVTAHNGVVAIGTASGMTPQQTYWLQAKKAVNQALVAAQTHADNSFENTVYTKEAVMDPDGVTVKTPARDVSNGEMLANVIMARAIDGTNAVVDLRFVPDMVKELTDANADLELAMKSYIGALAAFALYDKDDTTWSAAITEIEAVDIDAITNNTITIGSTPINLSADSNFMYVYNKYNKIKAVLTYVNTKYEAYMATEGADNTAVAWADASTILFTNAITDDDTSKFVDYNEVTLNGKTPTYIKDNIIGDDASPSNSALVDFGMDFAGNGVVDFTSNSGVHADFAEVVGEYQSEINVTVKYGTSSIEAKNVKLRAVKDSGVAGVNLYGELKNQPNASDGAASSNPITDVYGYRLDFAFRTNAANSSLMLQVDPTGRIYSTDGSEETMGNGSTMTFEILDSSFTQAQAKELMTAVRIVFINKEGNIVAIGALSQDATLDANYSISANGAITSAITLYEFSFVDGVIDLGDPKSVTDGKTELMALNQNEATQLSTLVYLDGDVVDNTMVPAESVAALKGTLNLQFSSSAELKPMDYTEFKATANNG